MMFIFYNPPRLAVVQATIKSGACKCENKSA